MSEQPGRRERKREETRRAIAESAMRLFVERGFDEVTVAEVAEAADVSVNTVFNYFRTKEELFFGSQETSDFGLDRVARDRKPGEPVVAFLRRHLSECIENFRDASRGRADHARGAALRRVLQGSPALQIHIAHQARGSARSAEDSLAAALAEDQGKGPNDPIPRLVAGQVLALYASLFLEAERRRRAGESPEKIRAYLASGAEAAINLLEHGIGDYGSRTR
jgi:AcrR family transcriptional regulator